jgi:hypothetical protein
MDDGRIAELCVWNAKVSLTLKREFGEEALAAEEDIAEVERPSVRSSLSRTFQNGISIYSGCVGGFFKLYCGAYRWVALCDLHMILSFQLCCVGTPLCCACSVVQGVVPAVQCMWCCACGVVYVV